ncbi:hypothetical protein LQ564_20805 [Massilia sp. G4R7]|uniref:Uncharacterized protein n=1 Tax=Massilia phyllostachyos TaxID=2898585 RepID=A0ABS8QAG7_9BURK|nr:hypothetical protein [Massilia phyllostachyos]MCD2518742.1 hypothetical protein [Massilia phyllostachyos]
MNWGDCDFDRDRWQHADARGRGCMVASLLDRHPPETMTAAEVRGLLGEPTGYADHDEDAAYVVAPAASARTRGTEQLLVYRTDRRNGRILGAELIAPP